MLAMSHVKIAATEADGEEERSPVVLLMQEGKSVARSGSAWASFTSR